MDFQSKIDEIVTKWNGGKSSFTLRTSGSTGQPKSITFSRSQLTQSALLTAKYFNLNEKDCLLICLNPDFIAGFMMVIRSKVIGASWIAIEPDKLVEGLQNLDTPLDFAAVSPLQLQNVLDNKVATGVFRKCKAIIVGGGKVSVELQKRAVQSGLNCFQTYAMTETITHCAIAPFEDEWFTTLEGFEISPDDRGCAVIQTPYFEDAVITNDLIELKGRQQFKLIGRYDNVINSGGIKVHPEVLEEQIAKKFKEIGVSNPFYITGRQSDRFGEVVVLMIEGKLPLDHNDLLEKLKKTLPAYHNPKKIIEKETFKRTQTGKIIR